MDYKELVNLCEEVCDDMERDYDRKMDECKQMGDCLRAVQALNEKFAGVGNLHEQLERRDRDIDELHEQLEQRDKLVATREVVEKMKAQLDKPRAASPEAKEKQAAKAEERKAATAKARAEKVAAVAPILRKHLKADITAKELTDAAATELPEGFTWHMVQNILSRELAPELVRTERKKGGDLYRLA